MSAAFYVKMNYREVFLLGPADDHLADKLAYSARIFSLRNSRQGEYKGAQRPFDNYFKPHRIL